MLNLSLAATLEKHKLDSTNPWYVLLDLSMNGSVILRLARSTDDVVFQGNTYSAFAFEIDTITDKSSGQLQQISLRAANANRLLEGYLTQYNGGVGGTVTIYVVSATNLAGEPDLMVTFQVEDASSDEEWATFTLGADNPMRQPMPKFIYMSNHCRHVYNSPTLQAANHPDGLGCGYLGPMASCSLTLDGPNGCRAHDNTARFGGFPGIDTQGFRYAF